MSTQPNEPAGPYSTPPEVSTWSPQCGTVQPVLVSGGNIQGAASPEIHQQNLATSPQLIAHITHAGLRGQATPLAIHPSIGLGVGPPLLATTGRVVTPIPAVMSSSPTGAGPTSLHSAANIRHLALSTAVVTSPIQRQLSFPGGMMMVPSLSPPRAISSGSPSQSVLLQPLQHRHDANELQILQAHAQQQQKTPGLSLVSQRQLPGPSIATVASATGSTIHHLGHSPMSQGGGVSPNPLLTNPIQQQLTMSGNQQEQQSVQQQQLLQGVVSQLSSQVRQQQMGSAAVLQQRRTSGSHTTGQNYPGATSEQSLSVSPYGKPIRTSPLQSPERIRKRLKVEEKPAPNAEIGVKRKLICDYKLREMARIKENYKENLTELFFLQNGENLMEYFTWKKRPTAQLLHFLKSGSLDSDDEDDSQEKSINNEVKVLTTSGGTAPLATPVAIATSLPVSIAAAQQDQTKRPGGRHGMIFGHIPHTQPTQASSMPGGIPLGTTVAATTTIGSVHCSTVGTLVNTTTTDTTICSSTVTTTITTTASALSISSTLSKIIDGSSGNVHITNTVSSSAMQSLMSPGQSIARPHSISAVYENAVGSQEAIVERAKQEAQVLQRVAELRKEGLWSSRRLPKVQEPARNKAHWDYLLEEMQWLAADFAQERKWKKAGARKIARMITRHFQELQQKEVKAEKEEGMKLKRIASNMAKMVKEFWSNIEKVVQYKQQSRLEEKRKKALDLHLSFIVDQTEKYSSWLTEGLNTAGITTPSIAGSLCSAAQSGPDDGDFEPIGSGADDEETIDLEETEAPDDDGTKAEVDALQRESELPLEDLLKSLPKEVLEKPASLDCSDIRDSGGEGDDEAEESIKDEEEFQSGEESGDDEMTLDEQEKHEKTSGHKLELDDLKNEGDLSIEELMKKYAGAYDSDFEAQLSGTSTESEDEEDDDDDVDDDDDDDDQDDQDDQEDQEVADTTEEEEEMEDDEEESEDVGLDFLSKDLVEEPTSVPVKQAESGAPNKEITDIAAAAESIQPTGYTLETTQVKTKVPFLLKHTLREYQHVGLDWLATLHDRKLNGILADEMGLGKTIQTIAVLAHLATEWGVWGPHLIVVPTSVMLNWELELKKWCPAFKILTYYGNQKERKLKRQGWTKTNAFHVCITSYKLVIQDHQAFRRKKWKYLILDEAQNIKNFKSQRWQTLLNFSSQRRLLLTGTPLQNSLMELWSLMHFLMPHVFQSHKEFKEWFANPLSSMIEGSREYNEQLIRRLHKVLRPFLLRRLKQDVEKQMPKKYEHVVMCHLSRRQRFLYDEFMAQSKTKETLASGHFMSVINILMQLRKVCNHPNLFDPRPIQSPFQMEGLTYHTPSLVLAALQKDPLETIDLNEWYPGLAQAEMSMSAFTAHRIQKLQTPAKLIEEIDNLPDPQPRLRQVATCKPFVFRSYTPASEPSGRCSPFVPIQHKSASTPSKLATVPTGPTVASTSVISSTAGIKTLGESISVAETKTTQSTPGLISAPTSQGHVVAKVVPQQIPAVVSQSSISLPSTSTQQVLASHPITVQIHQTQQGTRLMIPSGSLSQLPAGFIQIVQTSSGQQLIAATSQPLQQSTQTTSTVVNGPSITFSTATTTSVVTSVTRPVSTVTLPISSSVASNGKPVVKVSPMTTASCQTTSSAMTVSSSIQVVKPTPVVASSQLATDDGTSACNKIRNKQEELAKQSVFYMPSLIEKKKQLRREKLKRLSTYNQKHCDMLPTFGQDLQRIVSVCAELPKNQSTQNCPWASLGYVHCSRVTSCCNPYHPSVFWNQTNTLRNMVHTPQQYMDELKEILDRFVFACPSVTSPRIQMHASHPAPFWLQEQRHREFVLKKELSSRALCLHNISARMTVQFPELRLIEYDCGKLQTLDLLLARLKIGSHRVLIFTQMTRMLDVLEQFLSYHGHRYLRLDGTTKVEQRQILMDRFNMDKRIFCFILSTRSGGIGVNLTGADTVVFYDSDWNPTMDAQAQDRCHRIGQTRDVHIYRLVSEMTIEENILKKANQKRLLGDVAIEGGNFTAAFFKQQTIKELFEEPSGLQALAKEQEKKENQSKPEEPEPTPLVTVTRSKRLSERKEIVKESKDPEQKPSLTEDQLEQALCAAEEETDIQSVSVVKAEQKAELAEFDENIPWDEREAELKKERDEELSKVEQELAMLEKELTAIERYAVVYMEDQMSPVATEELEKAEEEVTIAKEEWELSRLQALKEEDELRAELEEDEMLFTYARDDAYSQAYICDESGEHMPNWAPPTPPQDDNDVYIDRSMCFMYEPNIMLESQLPAIYVKKEQKRIRIDPAVAVARKHKVRKEEHHRAPRSLFDRPQSLLRKERDLKLMKLKQFAKPLKPQLIQSRPMDVVEAHSDWLVHEDWALLQALQMLQELPLTLTTDSPAIIPNWDMVSDMVNACSRTYRSTKQCKNRYENVIVPREEGKILYDVNPRKQKKSKGIYKTKNNRPMRTSQLYLQDNSNAIASQYSLRFDSCKAIAAKRTPTIRPTLANPTLKNPKHAAVLAENGINYEQPLTPTEVAAIRAERIAKEKQKNQEAAQQQLAAGQRVTSTPAVVATTQTAAVVTAALAGATTVQAAIPAQQMAIIPGSQLVSSVSGAPTTVVVTAASLQKVAAGSAVAAVSLARTLGPTGSIVVNPASAHPFAAINKKIAGQTIVGTVAQTLATTTQAARAARTGSTQMTVQEIAAVVNQSPARIGGHNTAQVITTTTLTPTHIIAAQKSANITTGAIPQGQLGTTKTLTPQQLQILRLKQQQLRRLTAVQAAAAQHTQTGMGQAAGIQKSVAISTPLITSIAQSQVSSARLQLAKQPGIKSSTVTRSLSEAEMASLLKRQQIQQQRTLSGATLSGATLVTQGSTPVQQVQVSQGHMARLTTAQILTGTQLQHVQAGQSASGVSSGAQPVATLVKTVSTQGSATVPSVTIPVTAVSLGLGISVNVPTQKAIPAKNIVTQQMRQIQLQQFQRNKQLQVAAAQQKVATLGQLQQVKGPGGTTPLIIPPQQQATTLPKVMVQQIHQIVKQQPTIQQIIASVPPSQTTTAAVIATQLVSQTQPTVQTVSRMSVPAASSPVTQAIKVAPPVTATIVTGTTSQGVTMATGALITGTPMVTPSQTTLVKNLQEVITPQKPITGTIQQVKTVQQATAAVRQIQGSVTLAQIPSSHSAAPAIQVQQLTSAGQTIAVTSTPKIIQQQPSPIVQQLVQPGTTVAQMVQPSPGVQQAVQKVVQEAQAQAQHRVAVTVGGTTITHHTPVTITQNPVVVSGTQAQTIQQLTTTVAGQAQIPGQDSQSGKNSPYTMRLRNQRT